MRVTNSMLTSSFLNNLSNNLNRLEKLQYQLATNRKYAHISDDPISVIYSQQARYKLNRLGQYKKNVEMAQNWLAQAEEGIMDINELIKSAYETAIDVATSIKTDEDRKNAAKYVGQLKDQLLQSLNATFGDKYVFGGYNTTGADGGDTNIPPFTIDTDGNLCFNGISFNSPGINALKDDVLTFDVGIGSEIKVTINGVELAQYHSDGDNLYNLLNELYAAMSKEDSHSIDEISTIAAKLQTAQSHVLSLAAEIGGRTNRLDILSLRYDKDEVNYIQMKSNAEDADQAEVIMKYKMAESVYNAALSTGAYIIMPTLMDFLR